MSLFPFVTTEDLTLTDQEVTASSIREYEIDFEKGTLTGRIVTGVDALCVWAYLALKAKRYRWIIYSSNRYRDVGGRLLYVPQTKISA